MPKKPRVRTPMDSQHVKGSKRLLNFSVVLASDIFWSLRNKITSKNSILLVSEILRLFVDILTPDDKYSLSVKGSS